MPTRFAAMRRLLVASVLPVTLGAQQAAPRTAPAPDRRPAPNTMGVIPVLEYHIIGDRDSRWGRHWERFAKDLELLHARGYRPISVRQLVTRRIDIPPGTSPVVITFDDASPGQFRYLEENGTLRVDPRSAVGIWEAFAARHPEWKGRGVFCVLPSADQGHALFGDKGIQGQKTAWRMQKVRFLVERGYELCNHTLWHANLGKMSDATVQEQIARAQLAVDSAGTRAPMRTMALPLGIWPKNRALLSKGSWRDPKTGRVTAYEIDAVLMVAGGPAKSPFDPAFDPLRIPRVQVFGDELERLLDRLDRPGLRFVQDSAHYLRSRAK